MKKILLIFITSMYVSLGFTQLPTNLVVNNVTDSSAVLSWDNGNCTSLELRIKRDVDATWQATINIGTSISGTNGTYYLTGIDDITTYNWQLNCGNWQNGPNFTTLCNKSVSQAITAFDPNPLFGYMQFSYDTLTIVNTANCDINIRPEFIISHPDSVIEVGDFTIEWYNPYIGNWPDIPYNIDNNGNAYGFWSTSATDTTGINLTVGTTQQMIIRVRFMNPNNNPNPTRTPYGLYTASWTTYEVDNIGNIIQTLAPADSVSLSLFNCNLLSPNISQSNISCFGNTDGSISIDSIEFGSGNYSYHWNTGNTTNSISGLSAGNYYCNIVDLGYNCTDSINFTLASLDSISSSFTTTDVSCYGINDGAADVTFFGGTLGNNQGDTNYILGWDTLLYYLPYPGTTFTTPIGVPAGVYPYTVTDMNGCTHSNTIIINQPDSLYTTYTLSNYNGFNISCNGFNNGSIDIQIIGGTVPYTHYFNNNILATNNTIQNLPAGIYPDSITDNNGCVYTDTFTLIEPPPIITSVNTINTSCIGVCDGFAYVNINGGIPPYSYLWSNGQTTANASGLCAGLTSINISDNNNCISTANTNISEPTFISYNIDSIIYISAYGENDGSISISPTGGTGNLIISWIGPNNFTSYNQNIDSLFAGTYYLTISDNNGCLFTDSINLPQPSSLSANLNILSNISCNNYCDGAINITPDGGDSVYTYLWTGPNGYTSTNEDINGLCIGSYTLELSDTTTTIIYSFTINEPLPLTSNLTADTITCHNGIALVEILVYGGTPPFQYNWSNGGTNYFTNLNSGTHTVEVLDVNGCILLDTISITNPDSISISAINTEISCYGLQNAIVTLNIISGGTSPFQYSNNNGVNYQTVNNFYNVSSGIHNYLITDINGCSNSIEIIITQPDSLYSTINTNDVSCYGLCDGTASASVMGGTPPFIFDWAGVNPNALCAGFYNLNITDSSGCLTVNSIIVLEPNPIIINIFQNGTTLEATTGFVSYQWYDNNGNAILGANTNIFNPTIQGEYYVEVTDSNGCVANSYSVLFAIESINEKIISVNFYPNPTNNYLIIESSQFFQDIQLFNILGEEIAIIEINTISNTKKNINLSSLSEGIYFIQISINNQLFNQKIIRQ